MIEKGIEYWHLVDRLQRAYVLLLNEEAIKESNTPLYISAYMIRRDVIDRIKKYKWEDDTQIAAPHIPNVKTLKEALTTVLSKLQDLSGTNFCNDEVENILRKGNLYYELDEQLSDINKMF